MATVFIALTFVVLSGNGIILFVNKFLPEEEKASAKPKTQTAQTSSSFDSKKMAAIVAAVDITTNGRGKVISVEKA